MGGMGGMGAPHGDYGGMGGMGGMRFGGMGAPPGGFMASLVNPSPSTNVDAYRETPPSKLNSSHGDSSHVNTTVQESQEEETQNGNGNGYEDVDK